MIEAILPPGFAAAEFTHDPVGIILLPDEEACVARASDARRREFSTVRHCARAAFRELGIAPVAIPRGERGEPCWPPEVVGSMTHCTGYRAAAVVRRDQVRAVGIDAEPHRPLPRGVLEIISLPTELVMLNELAARHPDRHWDCILFSVKESVYKAWFPATRGWLDFRDVAVTFDVPSTSFVARILGDARARAGPVPDSLPGRFLVRDGLVLSATVLPGDGRVEHYQSGSTAMTPGRI